MSDDIIIAGEDEVPTNRENSSKPICDKCGTELEWKLNQDCTQERYCPTCDD